MTVLPEEFTERLARVMKLVRTQRTLPTQLEAAVALAKRTVPMCDAAGISLVIVGEPMTAAATDRVALEIDLVQYETGEGPCMEAMVEDHIVRVDLIGQEIRYSRFVPGALDTGINSVASFPLRSGARPVGAFNLYSYQANGFDETTERVMEHIVGYASDVLARSPLYAYSLDVVDGLLESLADQAVVAQATGLLMARNGWTTEEAFRLIRERALVHGASLRETAGSVLDEEATGGAGGATSGGRRT